LSSGRSEGASSTEPVDKGDPNGSAELTELEASQTQLWGEFRARKSKQNQGNFLGFPWIPLADSGLFNGLRGIQRKKIVAR
jgi:hypothetical protein